MLQTGGGRARAEMMITTGRSSEKQNTSLDIPIPRDGVPALLLRHAGR